MSLLVSLTEITVTALLIRALGLGILSGTVAMIAAYGFKRYSYEELACWGVETLNNSLAKVVAVDGESPRARNGALDYGHHLAC